jgi:Tfp pilus assembly protein PilN
MLRTNLSTRPFYNERAVHVVLGVVAVLVGALTAVTLFQMVRLSRQNTELSANVNRDRSEAVRLTREAERIRRGINQDELQLVVASAREANSLIDQRTFSWTAFFNQIEDTLPPDVRLTGVQPAIGNAGLKVNMIAVARRAVDIDEFMEKLEATGAFEGVLHRQQEDLDGGLTRVVVEAVYVPAAAPANPDERDKTVEPAKSAAGAMR